LKFNNPILNIKDEPSQKPFLKEKDVPQEQQYPAQHVTFTSEIVNKKDNTSGRSSPKTENTFPNWADEFPFIDHGEVNSDVRNQLWKAIPKTSEWEKFSGELPYNHELWLKNIDVFVQDYLLTDDMVVSRLTALFTDTAKNWYLGIRDQCGKKSWSWWKHTIRNKFGTHNWKWKMRMEFEKDYFTVDNRKVHKWFSTQRERLRAYQPELSESLVCEKVLKQCPGSLEHAVKSRCNRAAEDMNFEEMVIIIEEVLERAMGQYKPLHNNIPQVNRSSWRNSNQTSKDEVREDEPDSKRPPTSNPQAITGNDVCHFCKQPGHFSKECPRKKKRINNVGFNSYDEDKEQLYNNEFDSGSQYDKDEENPNENHMIPARDNHSTPDPLVDFNFD
jgi:hypothetical protein